MITNDSVTIFHNKLNANTKSMDWQKYYYEDVWFFGGKGASVNKGYNNANDVDVRIPYNKDLDINNFSIGDILVKGRVDTNDINSLKDKYAITSINNNNFGNNPHIHIGGK